MALSVLSGINRVISFILENSLRLSRLSQASTLEIDRSLNQVET